MCMTHLNMCSGLWTVSTHSKHSAQSSNIAQLETRDDTTTK